MKQIIHNILIYLCNILTKYLYLYNYNKKESFNFYTFETKCNVINFFFGLFYQAFRDIFYYCEQ